MRNLAQYPIVVDEVLDSVENAQDHFESLMQLGDIRPVSLRLTLEFLKENQVQLMEFLSKVHEDYQRT